jgi:uncharacterized membrane protein
MAYGLLAALSWGVAGFGAALAARRIGAFRTVVIGEVAALTGYVVLFLLGPFSLRGTGPVVWLLMLAGVIGLGGYLTLYRGLESGHVGLVSAISASYAGVTVILSVLVLGERLTAAAAAGVVARVGAMAVLLALLATPLRRSAVSQRGLGIAWAAGAGLVDAAGVAFFARGDQVGLISITAASSSAYPIIPLLGGLVLLHERMARRQAGGVVLILVGLVLLGAGS